MEQIDVRILDRDFRLSVEPEGRERLLAAAQMVDEKMRAIRDGGRIIGTDRIAVMAALQLAHEMLTSSEESGPTTGELIRRLKRIKDDVDEELRRQETLF